MLLLSRFEVTGHSMLPTLKSQQQVLASFLPYLFSSPKIDDIIIFKKENKNIVKRIKKISGNRFEVAGDNVSDSKDFGVIKRSEILGKVVFLL